MVNNYVKHGQRFFFFDDSDRLSRIIALGKALDAGASVYRRPANDPMWERICAVGDGIGTLEEIPEEAA